MNKNFLKILSLSCCLLGINNLEAQTVSHSQVGLTTMISGNIVAPALSYTNYWSLKKAKQTKLQIGIGGRYTQAFGGAGKRYITAPAKLTTGKTGPLVFFSNQITINADTFGLSKTSIGSLNAVLAFNYKINSKINVEFNIDLLGISLGGKQNAYLRNQAGKDSTLITATAKPTVLNALLTSDNDLGSLNSELVGAYSLNKKFSAKVGLGFLFSEYTFTNPTYINTSGVVVNNDRFRNKSLGLEIGIIYKF
jgi:hypothetical protein